MFIDYLRRILDGRNSYNPHDWFMDNKSVELRVKSGYIAATELLCYYNTTCHHTITVQYHPPIHAY